MRLLSQSRTSFRLAGQPSALQIARPLFSVAGRRGRDRAADGPSHRPGEGRRRRNPAAFYWHPCRESASVPRALTASSAETSEAPCASPSISPTSRRIPEPFCGFAPASGSRRTSSSRPGSRPPTAPSAAPAWTISMRSRSCGTPHGRISRLGGAAKATASCCSRPARHCPISITAIAAADILLFGRESAGVPEEVHAAADARLVIPMRPGLRSLNVAVAAAMAAGEALRQIGREAVR